MSRRIIKPCLSAHLILGTLFGFGLFIILANVYMIIFDKINSIIILIIILIGLSLANLYLTWYTIIVDDFEIKTRKSLFNLGINSINIMNIEKIEVCIGDVKKNGFYTLVLNDSKHKLNINMKIFYKSDIAYLCKKIINKNKGIQIDELSKDVINENYKVITKHGVNKFFSISGYMFLCVLMLILIICHYL